MRLSYIHQAYGYGKNDIPRGGSNPGPSGRESSALTARPGSHPYKYKMGKIFGPGSAIQIFLLNGSQKKWQESFAAGD